MKPIARIVFTVIVLGVLIVLTWTAARAGYASLLTTLAARTAQIDSANRAVNLSPRDPDAHMIRASLLQYTDLPSAIAEYEQAASLRPADYVGWINLARTCELSGDFTRATAAGEQATRLAPYYAQPHWQLGNILVRAGKNDDGFRELTLAGKSNPTLMWGIADLAWTVSRGDATSVVRWIQPPTAEGRVALAQYLRHQKQIDPAIAMYVAAGELALSDRSNYLAQLIREKRIKQAVNLWTADHPEGVVSGVLSDPGFEKEGNVDEPGFAWYRDERLEGFTLSLDSANPKEGSSSLKVDFSGDSNPVLPVISQLVLIEPNSRYQLSFSVRTENIVSAGGPLVVVVEADSDKVLAATAEFPRSAAGWIDVTLDFMTGPSSTGVQIALRRNACSTPPCPIFGRTWLDNFRLQKL